MTEKPYFHELTIAERQKMLNDKKTNKWLVDNYNQPDWCSYPNALNGLMGCWTLCNFSKKEPIVTLKQCEKCDCFNKNYKQ